VERETLSTSPQVVLVKSPTFADAAAIESCDFRRSDCACLGKPATCLQAGLPATVVCLTNGPDGGPCAGT